MKLSIAKLVGWSATAGATATTFALAPFAKAQTPAPAAGSDLDFFFGGDSGSGKDAFAGASGLGNQELTTTIASIINTALSFLGIVAVVIILYGGFLWMTSGGNDDKVKQAKKLMISGVIGLAIILSSFAIATFVIGRLATATS